MQGCTRVRVYRCIHVCVCGVWAWFCVGVDVIIYEGKGVRVGCVRVSL